MTICLSFGHNMAFGLAFGHNKAFGLACGHNTAFGSAFGRNMAFGPAFGHNAAFGPAFGHNKLLITAFGHIKLFKLCRLIVQSKYSRNSKISLHFRKDCRIFCEGEWEQSQQLTHIFDNDSNATISQQLIGLGQTGLVSLVGHIGSVNRNGSVDCNGLAGFISLGLVGFISVGLISLVSGFGLVGLGGISGLAS
jgi:hypothetical protein